MHAFLLRLPAPPYLQGPLDLAALSKSRQSVSHSVSQSVSQLFPPVRETPFLQRGTFTIFLIANAFHFLYLGSFHVFHLTLR